ncbi:hypothetical protein [Microbacterium sp. OR16]|uniref:hypothetical protein n=1 Tax=Microbacterium sp. OR16 TaxID=3095345 RepID=UPI0039B3EF83
MGIEQIYYWCMSKLTPLIEAMSSLDRSWGEAEDATDLTREQLIAIDSAIGMVKRRLDAVHADVAAGISGKCQGG